MGHYISAIVTKQSSLLDKLSHQKLPQDFALLLDTESNRKALTAQDFVSIWTDYFGGLGEQGCTIFEANKTECICDKCGTVLAAASEKLKNINEGLKRLGVTKADSDEFDAINLGNFRSNEDISDDREDDWR
jgi:hypothetical protein